MSGPDLFESLAQGQALADAAAEAVAAPGARGKRPPPGTPGTCGACRHWLAGEAKEWQQVMWMACCDQKRTKSISLGHFRACLRYEQAAPEVVARRVADMRRVALEWKRNTNDKPRRKASDSI